MNRSVLLFLIAIALSTALPFKSNEDTFNTNRLEEYRTFKEYSNSFNTQLCWTDKKILEEYKNGTYFILHEISVSLNAPTEKKSDDKTKDRVITKQISIPGYDEWNLNYTLISENDNVNIYNYKDVKCATSLSLLKEYTEDSNTDIKYIKFVIYPERKAISFPSNQVIEGNDSRFPKNVNNADYSVIDNDQDTKSVFPLQYPLKSENEITLTKVNPIDQDTFKIDNSIYKCDASNIDIPTLKAALQNLVQKKLKDTYYIPLNDYEEVFNNAPVINSEDDRRKRIESLNKLLNNVKSIPVYNYDGVQDYTNFNPIDAQSNDPMKNYPTFTKQNQFSSLWISNNESPPVLKQFK